MYGTKQHLSEIKLDTQLFLNTNDSTTRSQTFLCIYFGFAINHRHHLIEDKLVKKCNQIKKKTEKGGNNWLSKNTYNTLGTFDIVDNKDFLPIQNFVIDAVMSYANHAQIDVTHLNHRPHEGWFNIYEKIIIKNITFMVLQH